MRYASTAMKPRIQIALLILMSAIIGCDPVVRYDVKTSDGDLVPTVDMTIDSVNFTLGGLHELTASTQILHYIRIENNSSKTMAITSAKLTTESWMIQAELPGMGDPKWRTVRPEEIKEIPFMFRFPAGVVAEDRPATNVKMTWEYRIGKDIKSIEISLLRSPDN